MRRNPDIEKLAAGLYQDDLPYHNFGHVIEVLSFAERIMKKCRQEGVDVDDEIVYLGILFHDAGFAEDHLNKGFDSKEAYSAYLAGEYLGECDYPASVIEKVKAVIMATHCDGRCLSNEDKAVRAADLYGMGMDYEYFKMNTLKLKQEHEQLSGDQLTWKQWQDNTVARVELFLREDIGLTSDYYDTEGESVFHQHVRNNLQQLLADRSASG